MTNLPPGWRYGTLQDVVAGITTGVSVNGEDRSREPGEVGVLKISCVLRGRFDPAHYKTVISADRARVAAPVTGGTILVSRANTAELVGASAYVPQSVSDLFLPDKLWQLKPGKNVDVRWLSHVVADPAFRPKLASAATGTSASMKNISQEAFLALPVAIPPLPEQRRIAAILGTWDAAIEKAERLARLAADALSSRRIFLLSARLNQKRSEWRTVTFSDVTEELTSRNGTRLTFASVMGVIKGDGFQPMRERTIGSDLSRYKIVPPSAFAYNPMRLNIGSLAFSTLATDILVSPDYVVFAAKRETCAPEFLNELRQSPRWAAWCQQGGSGSVRTRIYYSDLIGMPIDLPPLSIQRRIAAVLADLANRHQTAVRRLELLREQKRGLMQRLLTGKVRVPEAVADLSPAAD
ncbi:restriction endonuclease subunit S [Acidiphilium sp.]|uniref:restriction endonuclease subunit S n=1 Tax=Acidiphilium sp. TaxID=527 RepID=UPI002582D331|nr:restriction endonuclease subunit S [Acidiphilium sp.]